MKVYRVCDSWEMAYIFYMKSLKYVGNKYCNAGYNQHNYQEDVEYVHFFERYESIFYLLDEKISPYVCTYDIPNEILAKTFGSGFYPSLTDKYDNDIVTEFAIPNTLVSFDYLVKAERLQDKVTYEDYLNNQHEGHFVTLYNKEAQLVRKPNHESIQSM